MAFEAATETPREHASASFPEDSLLVARHQGAIDTLLIREQVDRILSCDHFKTSARISRFLRYVTEAALDGRSDEIKETSIGVSVYDRAPTYDPKLDTVVRSEARRLRQKLDRYFSEQGQFDPIRISLPKGGYVPVFTVVAAAATLVPEEVIPATAAERTEIAASDSKVSGGAKPRSRKLFVAFLISVIGLLLGVFLLSFRGKAPEQWNAVSRISPLTSFPGESYQPNVSPDGKSIAFIWNNGGPTYSIYVIQQGGRPLRVTASPESDLHPVWSPDGGSLAFLRVSSSGAQVMMTSFPGGRERSLFTLRSGRPWSEDELGARSDTGPSWSSDGKQLIISDTAPSGRGFGLYAYSLGNNELYPLTYPTSDERDLDPVLSSDGKWIAYARFSSYDAADVFVSSLADHTERRLTSDNMDIEGLAWSHDNHEVIFSSNRDGAYGLWTTGLDGAAPTPIATTGEAAIQPAISQSGSFLVYADSTLRSRILKVSLQPAGTAVSSTDIAPSTRRSHSAQFSPDGSRIAFVSDRSGKWELWVSRADGRDATQLTDFEAATVGSPRWSPDGRSIAFDARPNGHSSVYVVLLDGERLRNLTPKAYEAKQPAWSADGKWIFFDSNMGGPMQLWKMTADGSDPKSIAPIAPADVHASPDGHSLYFTNGPGGLWQMSLNGGDALQVPGLQECRFGRLWTVTATGIYFVDIKNDRSKLRFFDFQTHRSRPVLALPAEPLIGYPSLSFSPTENSILFAAKEDPHSDLMTLWPKQQH